jgi:hypothetical protein
MLKVNDENTRIRIRIHESKAWIRGSSSGSGSTPKYHVSATLVSRHVSKISLGLFYVSMHQKKAEKLPKKSHMDILSSNFKKSTLQIIEFS